MEDKTLAFIAMELYKTGKYSLDEAYRKACKLREHEELSRETAYKEGDMPKD